MAAHLARIDHIVIKNGSVTRNEGDASIGQMRASKDLLHLLRVEPLEFALDNLELRGKALFRIPLVGGPAHICRKGGSGDEGEEHGREENDEQPCRQAVLLSGLGDHECSPDMR